MSSHSIWPGPSSLPMYLQPLRPYISLPGSSPGGHPSLPKPTSKTWCVKTGNVEHISRSSAPLEGHSNHTQSVPRAPTGDSGSVAYCHRNSIHTASQVGLGFPGGSPGSPGSPPGFSHGGVGAVVGAGVTSGRVTETLLPVLEGYRVTTVPPPTVVVTGEVPEGGVSVDPPITTVPLVGNG